MEGRIATWYAKNTSKDIAEFRSLADRFANETRGGESHPRRRIRSRIPVNRAGKARAIRSHRTRYQQDLRRARGGECAAGIGERGLPLRECRGDALFRERLRSHRVTGSVQELFATHRC